MEKQGYQGVLDITFKKLEALLNKELSYANEKLIQEDECQIKAVKIINELGNLIKQYYPTIDTKPTGLGQYITEETRKIIQKNINKHHKLELLLREKKQIIILQLEAHCDRAMEQQLILENYIILKKGGRVAPVTISLLKSLLDLPADTELFGGTEQ